MNKRRCVPFARNNSADGDGGATSREKCIMINAQNSQVRCTVEMRNLYGCSASSKALARLQSDRKFLFSIFVYKFEKKRFCNAILIFNN